jgi:hypothetical protein
MTLISDLPSNLAYKCYVNQKAQGNSPIFKGELRSGKAHLNFNWDESPEGYQFWDEVSNMNWKAGRNHELLDTLQTHFPHIGTNEYGGHVYNEPNPCTKTPVGIQEELDAQDKAPIKLMHKPRFVTIKQND